MRLGIILIVLAGVVAPSPVDAQATLSRGDRFFDVSTGVSFFTNDGPHFALLRNRKVFMLGFRNERVFSVGSHFAWSSTVELPVSLIMPQRGAPSAVCWWRTTTKRQECYDVSHPRDPVGALGLTPLGIKLYYGPSHRVRLYGALAGGFVAFDRSTPVTAASALNFAVEYQLGAEVGVSEARSLVVAWKFQHWSNANLTYFNPGLDVNLITIGLKRRR